MHTRLLLLVVLAVVAGACTHAYTPHEYALTQDRIPAVRASAPVAVVNVQQRGGAELMFAMGAHKWVGSPQQITQQFAEQLSRSLQQAGVQIVPGAAPKRLDVSVVSLSASAGFYHYKAKAVVAVMTADNQRFEFVANNSSGGNIDRALNGVIAIAVLETMKHPGLQAYLAAPAPTAAVPQSAPAPTVAAQ
jgi:hypothetical protein